MTSTTSTDSTSGALNTSMPLETGLLEAISTNWSPEQIAAFLAGVARCEQALSSHPFHASRAAKDPEYWLQFCASRPLRYADQGPFSREIERERQRARLP